jgi:hypothetical protein
MPISATVTPGGALVSTVTQACFIAAYVSASTEWVEPGRNTYSISICVMGTLSSLRLRLRKYDARRCRSSTARRHVFAVPTCAATAGDRQLATYRRDEGAVSGTC